MLAQFVDGGMVIAADLIGQRQVRRIEDARLRPKQLEQTRRFLDREPRIGALAQRTVEKQNTGWRLIVAEASSRPGMNECRVQRREGVWIGEWA